MFKRTFEELQTQNKPVEKSAHFAPVQIYFKLDGFLHAFCVACNEKSMNEIEFYEIMENYWINAKILRKQKACYKVATKCVMLSVRGIPGTKTPNNFHKLFFILPKEFGYMPKPIPMVQK